MKIAVIGTGYVGLVTGTCLAETGNNVTCIDVIQEKIDSLKRGEIPFYEPGLTELVQRNMREGRLQFVTNMKEGVPGASISFICVGTPSREDGSADLSQVIAVVDAIVQHASGEHILTIKSTVPVGSADKIREHLQSGGKSNIEVASNPEFLREGTAVQDCLQPDRILIGTESEEIAELFRELYYPYVRTGAPIYVFDNRSAEMAKYAANALLATRVSFMNEVSMLCEKLGADVTRVRAAIGADKRIGTQYLFPSLGFGGSCFPKDVRALASIAREAGMVPRLMQATLDVNEARKKSFVKRIVKHFESSGGLRGKRIAIWGLAFKAKTDDIRESPALTVVDELLEEGATLVAYDPAALSNVQALYGDRLQYTESSYEALEKADALCVLTEWNQFRHPDFGQIKKLLRSRVIFDGRNLYDGVALKKLGFQYYSIGRADK